jgi:hypothetical protein
MPRLAWYFLEILWYKFSSPSSTASRPEYGTLPYQEIGFQKY